MKRMLVDATHPEETRVAIVNTHRDHHRLDDYDYALASKPILRGNIYLAKVMRIEPSLQAAFVEYGGNRHGFLPFTEIHPDYYRIPMADRPPEEQGADEDYDDDQSGESFAEHSAHSEQDSGDDGDADQHDTPEHDHHETESGHLEQPQPSMAVDHAPAIISTPLGQPPADGEDHGNGLITDFGNAALISPGITEVETPAQQPETVGGEVAERIVRKSRPRYKIQEVIKRGQIMLVQVVKEERGNKGAALTTFLSLAGRYAVLMPNTDHGGGVSRKITNHQDRRRMKEMLDQLAIPEGMGVILRTAGMQQEPPEIQRDVEYLMRLWDNIREQTLQSNAPSLIYEEANLIKRSVRDLYAQDINEILVAGEEGYSRARDFMRAIMPDQVDKIKPYGDAVPLFFRYHVENQIDALHNPVVQLRSGGYIVINPTEALVAIDVNSGRATRERHIEGTALKTNLEAAEEIARQLRLRDLAGLIVIDFIDMEDGRNNAAVERRIKESMKNDRARLQIGRISPFGLLELSRQRLRPSLVEINFEKCPHCTGVGLVRSVDSAALSILRAIEEEGIRQRNAELIVHVPTKIALYILNQKRAALSNIEQRYDLHVLLHSDDTLVAPDYRLERIRTRSGRNSGPAVNMDQVLADTERDYSPALPSEAAIAVDDSEQASPAEYAPNQRHGREPSQEQERGQGRRRYRPYDRRNRQQGNRPPQADGFQPIDGAAEAIQPIGFAGNEFPSDLADAPEAGIDGTPSTRFNGDQDAQRRRRRGRRGGRRRFGQEGREHGNQGNNPPQEPAYADGAAVAVTANYMPPAQPAAHSSFVAAEAPRQAIIPPVDRYIPTSVHELDTTPKPARAEPELPRPTSYEVVNPPSDRPKGGWWKRLTGQ
jgi:ribonuclease E